MNGERRRAPYQFRGHVRPPERELAAIVFEWAVCLLGTFAAGWGIGTALGFIVSCLR